MLVHDFFDLPLAQPNVSFKLGGLSLLRSCIVLAN